MALLLSLIKITVGMICLWILRAGLQSENFTGHFFALIAVWLFFTAEFSLFWFAGFNSSDKQNGFILNVKKSILSFLNFPFFTSRVLIINILYLFMSVLTFFSFPGLAGIVFNTCIAYKHLREK